MDTEMSSMSACKQIKYITGSLADAFEEHQVNGLQVSEYSDCIFGGFPDFLVTSREFTPNHGAIGVDEIRDKLDYPTQAMYIYHRT